MTVVETVTLDDAIKQMIAVGHKDPYEIASMLRHRYGDDWYLEQLEAEAEQIVAGRARLILGSQRRAATLAIRPGDRLSHEQVKLCEVWVPDALGPGVGAHKRMADCTVEDFEARAAYMSRLAAAAEAQAQWFAEVAGLMRREGVVTFGALRGELPVLRAPLREVGPA